MADVSTRRLPKAERHAQLVRAAASAFLERGYAGTSMESVAERAGVTRLIVYRHFENKSALYRAVLDTVTSQLRDRVDVDEAASVTGILVEVARDQPDAFRLLWRHARHEPEFSAEAELFRLVAAEFAHAVIGRYIADQITLDWASATLVDYLHDGICNWLDHGELADDTEFAERLRAGSRALVLAWAD
jgi:AcrR family transcriptional regulator